MKKFRYRAPAAILVVLAMLFSLAACGGGESGQQPEPEQPEQPGGQYAAEVDFGGGEIKITGSGAHISGETLVVAQPGTYRLTGELPSGAVVVEAANATLVLAGVSITNPKGPAILFRSTSEESAITLEQSSKNMLADGGENAEYDAALFSLGSLIISGTGALEISGNNQEGIAAQNNITILDGEIRVSAKDDGINASAEGLANITIAGGYVYVSAEGDGIDSNGSIDIVGGTVIALGSVSDMSGGLDADGAITVAPGATVIATGASNSRVTPEEGANGFVVDFGETLAAEQLVVIQQGSIRFLAFRPARAFSQLLYIGGSLEDGAEYEVYLGGEIEGDSRDGLYYQNAVYSVGRLTETVTTESLKNMGGPGGEGGPGEGAPPPTIQPRQ